MLNFTDNLHAVAEAFKGGEISPEDVHIYMAPRLEHVPEKESRRLLNDLELAVYTLPEPGRRERILEILGDAWRVASSCGRPDVGDA